MGLALVGFILGFTAFGVAFLRTEGHSRTVGLVILLPGLIIVLMLAHIAAGLETPQTAFVVSAGQAMAHLAIGATLRAETGSAEQEDTEAVPDATAKG